MNSICITQIDLIVLYKHHNKNVDESFKSIKNTVVHSRTLTSLHNQIILVPQKNYQRHLLLLRSSTSQRKLFLILKMGNFQGQKHRMILRGMYYDDIN